jgi:hypothetical protein
MPICIRPRDTPSAGNLFGTMPQNPAHLRLPNGRFKGFTVARELLPYCSVVSRALALHQVNGPADVSKPKEGSNLKMLMVALSLLTVCLLMLAVTPAMAQQTLYSNGPYNGTTDAWTINFGFSVSDSFDFGPDPRMKNLHFVYWDPSTSAPSDILTTLDMQIGSTSFGGTPQTLTGVVNTFLSTNQYGYSLFQADFSFADIPWSGAGYITLSNACTTSGCSVSTPIYWDENSGVGCGGYDGHGAGCPSTAYENTLGSIPSEAFTLGGTRGTTPEPSSIMLFASCIVGVAGVLRRRLRG